MGADHSCADRPKRFDVPAPVLAFGSLQDEGGQKRLRFSITNWLEFADSFFANSPDLPPVGLKFAASRIWITFQDTHTGASLYNFPAIRSAQQLADLTFILPPGPAPPPHVRVKVRDRRTGVEQLSNTVNTTAPRDDRRRTERHL